MIKKGKKKLGLKMSQNLFHLCSFRYFAGTFSNNSKLFLAETIFLSLLPRFLKINISLSAKLFVRDKIVYLLRLEETLRTDVKNVIDD